jgi:UDP-glucose 6-dehydrogenase
MKIAIAGTGYIGLSNGALFAHHNSMWSPISFLDIAPTSKFDNLGLISVV